MKTASMDNTITPASKSPINFNEAFTRASNDNSSGTSKGITSPVEMASMPQIISGKFIDETFENLSTDEKLSMILVELYKMRDSITTIQRSHSVLSQKVDTHEQELTSRAIPSAEEAMSLEEERQIEANKNSIIDIHNVQYDIQDRLKQAEESIHKNAWDTNLLKGTVERQHKQIENNQHKIVDLTARSMDHNFTITSLVESREENCKMVVMDFLKTKLNLNFDQNDIIVAHRMGVRPITNCPRLMVVKVTTRLKEQIMANTSRLKGKQNEQGLAFYVNLQLPDALASEKRALQYETKRIKDFNEALPAGYKKKQFTVKNKKLYVDDKLQEPLVFPPKPLDLFVNDKEQKALDQIDFNISKPKNQDRSQFIGLATRTYTTNHVQMAYKKVRQMYPSYDHIIMAFTAADQSGYQNDGEHGAGIKLHAKLMAENFQNVSVFVARNFGGVHMGPARFDCIHIVADQALEGLVKEHPDAIRRQHVPPPLPQDFVIPVNGDGDNDQPKKLRRRKPGH